MRGRAEVWPSFLCRSGEIEGVITKDGIRVPPKPEGDRSGRSCNRCMGDDDVQQEGK